MGKQRTRMDERRTNSKERILEAAIERFARQGFKKTTLEEVASDVGLVKSAVYKHFPSKEALFNAVVDHFAAGFQKIAENSAANARTLRTQLYKLVEDSFDYQEQIFKKHHMRIEQWLEFMPLVIDRMRHHHTLYLDFFAQLIEKAAERGEVRCSCPQDYAHVFHAAFEQLFNEHFLGLLSAFDSKRLQKLAVDLFLAGITTQGTEA